jgi:hypothetical protein
VGLKLSAFERIAFSGTRMIGVIARAAADDLTGGADDLSAKSSQRLCHRTVMDATLAVECLRGLGHRYDERDRPAAQRSDDELHRVDRLEPLRSTRRRDQTHDLVSQVGPFAVSE